MLWRIWCKKQKFPLLAFLWSLQFLSVLCAFVIIVLSAEYKFLNWNLVCTVGPNEQGCLQEQMEVLFFKISDLKCGDSLGVFQTLYALKIVCFFNVSHAPYTYFVILQENINWWLSINSEGWFGFDFIRDFQVWWPKDLSMNVTLDPFRGFFFHIFPSPAFLSFSTFSCLCFFCTW